jgi:hypothetical protein
MRALAILLLPGALVAATSADPAVDEVAALGYARAVAERGVRTCDVFHTAKAGMTATRYGGGPRVPRDFTWPTRDGHPLALVAEIAVSECRHAPAYLPPGSMIMLFHDGIDRMHPTFAMRIAREAECTLEAEPPPGMAEFAKVFAEPEKHRYGYAEAVIVHRELPVISADLLLMNLDEPANKALWALRERWSGEWKLDGDRIVVPGVITGDRVTLGHDGDDPRVAAFLDEHGWSDRRFYLDGSDEELEQQAQEFERNPPEAMDGKAYAAHLRAQKGTHAWWAGIAKASADEIARWVPICVVGSSFDTGMFWGDYGDVIVLGRLDDHGSLDPGKVFATVASP